MVKKISNKAFLQMCKDIKEYVEKNYQLPNKLTYDGINYYVLEYVYAMSYGVYHLKSDFTIPNFKWADDPKGDRVNENVVQSDYMDMAKRVYNFILKNGKVPNFVKTVKGKMNVDIRLYVYCIAKCVVFYTNYKHLASNVQIDYRAFVKPSPKKTYSEEIFDYFCSKFGKPTSIDDALRGIRNKGYGFYYDDHLTNIQTIDGLAGKGQKPNCTDVHQMLWHIAKVLGYDVRAIHVWCTGSQVGHVRLDFNKGNGWFSRDGAAVIDGECVECIWCANGEYLATNPYWFISNLNR